MRIYIALLAATALTACGGGSAPQTIGGSAITPNTGATGAAVSGGPGGGVTNGTGSGTTDAAAGFLALSAEKSFSVLGASQTLTVSTTGTLYQGNASTVRTPTGTISYDPRDGIFNITLADTKAGLNETIRFQDPAHRTDFSPNDTPSISAPNLAGFNYLQAAGGHNFFYQRPGVSTNYVSLAGYIRDTGTPPTAYTLERAAFVFGEQTLQSNIPSTGSGTYTGGFLASMVNNPTFDASNPSQSYFQWILGNSTVAVDFTKSTVGLTFAGTVEKAYLNSVEILNTTVKAGATFNATAAATIDLVHSGGFTGKFSSVSFKNPDGTALPVDFAAISAGSSTAGASSVDGTFFGPGAVNVGGNFRVVGGIPDQRVDIQGAFVGAKAP
jgi:hypothetical protein